MAIHKFIRRPYQLFCSWPSRVIHPQPSPESCLPFPFFEDQVPKVKQAQRSLFDRETLLAKGNSNRQEAKELSQSIDHLKNSSLSVDPELSQLEARHVELKKELGDVKAAIDCHKSILAQIPDAIQQKKWELLAKVRAGRSI